MSLRQVILGVLVDQPLHGYALKRALAPGLPPSAQVNDGVLYPLLARLEKEGLVKSKEELGKNNKPRLRYSPTAKGRAALLRWLRESDGEEDQAAYDFFMGHPFLVKVLFFRYLSKQEREEKLALQLQSAEQKLMRFEQIRAGMVERNVDPYRIGLIELGIEQQKQSVLWLKQWLSRETGTPPAQAKTTKATSKRAL